MAGDLILTFSDADFETNIKAAGKAVLVDFWAAWCGPCKMIAPVIDEIAKAYADKLVVGKLNVDENNATAAKYGVMSIPTLLIFKDGEEVERIVGYKSKSELTGIINKLV